jgi:hypothetical protein
MQYDANVRFLSGSKRAGNYGHRVVAFRRNRYGPSKPVRILFQGSDSVGTTEAQRKTVHRRF